MGKLVFVAFGDSLTVGYQSQVWGDEWPQPTPYTGFLKEKTERMLDQRGAAGLRVEFLNRGVVGELTEDMVERLDRDVLKSRSDAVIILGGSNDLGWGHEPQSVVGNLARMYDEALLHRIQPVSCTVPSVLGFDEGIRPRLQLNQLIKKYSTERSIVCVDLFSATGDSSTGRLKEEYSNDGLHLSPLGYETVAEAIFSDAVSGIVSKRLGKMSDLEQHRHSLGEG
jgi:lysophospholipase L1-like esterase